MWYHNSEDLLALQALREGPRSYLYHVVDRPTPFCFLKNVAGTEPSIYSIAKFFTSTSVFAFDSRFNRFIPIVSNCCIFHFIECVRLTSSNSQIQNKRATKGFILIRHKRYQIYTCLQLSSSVASFVWKPAHFELRSYGGAWHNTKVAFVEKYTLISWFLAILGV